MSRFQSDAQRKAVMANIQRQSGNRPFYKRKEFQAGTIGASVALGTRAFLHSPVARYLGHMGKIALIIRALSIPGKIASAASVKVGRVTVRRALRKKSTIPAGMAYVTRYGKGRRSRVIAGGHKL